jgi:hypothetical protein
MENTNIDSYFVQRLKLASKQYILQDDLVIIN